MKLNWDLTGDSCALENDLNNCFDQIYLFFEYPRNIFQNSLVPSLHFLRPAILNTIKNRVEVSSELRVKD